MIYLKEEDYRQIVAFAKEGLPNESCGLLGGTISGDERTVKKVYYLTNTDASPEHFSMDPKEQLQAIRDMRNEGLTMIGNFHSHPETPSRPSQEDKRLAHDSKSRYLILSLQDMEHPVLKAFIVKDHTDVSIDEIRIVNEDR